MIKRQIGNGFCPRCRGDVGYDISCPPSAFPGAQRFRPGCGLRMETWFRGLQPRQLPGPVVPFDSLDLRHDPDCASRPPERESRRSRFVAQTLRERWRSAHMVRTIVDRTFRQTNLTNESPEYLG